MPLKKKKKKVSKKKVTTKKKKIIKIKVVKKVIKKSLVRKPKKKVAAKPKGKKENIIGKVTHYFPKVRAAVIKLKKTLSVGEVIRIKGHTTDFKQTVTSMQIDHVPVNPAKKGDEIGLLVNSRVRQHDIVCKVKGGEK